ncbi:MAG: M67 family metallopeptidase [Oscillatoriophycideae cyanobacterium NC_groundwater_1537_Pr4_S-0.65um_50_18]|nr:M67 family metallopeptidase [Oscillatoriophycideae cyanobacterium NC_groundwater_1537_Pr4_S-0.65um_50_18]
MLQMSVAHLQQICAHAQRTYPEECCGLLLGQLDLMTEQKKLVEVWETLNAWNSEVKEIMTSLISETSEKTDEPGQKSHAKSDRYWIDPKDLLAAQRHGRDRHLDIIGIYHSHPDHRAVPSECDRAMAWSRYSYLIISVDHGSAIDYRSWCLDDQHRFQSELLKVIEPSSL